MPLALAVRAFVLAGGSGSRLLPLTDSRCKPALPFGGNFRVVDFVLGNLLNSGVVHVELLVQYLPQTLLAHVREVWVPRFAAAGGRLGVAAPRLARVGFRGTADAVHQHLGCLPDGDPQRPPPGERELVLVFGADHVYRMDVRQMIDFHLAQHADATIATLPVPLAEAHGFGIVDTDATGRVWRLDEKPRAPHTLPGRPQTALASMGNYVFDAEVLREALERCGAAGEHDFGHHVLPRLIADRRVFAYDFTTNTTPGTQPHEEPNYWRDVGTVDAYFASHLDTLGDHPRFNLDNPRWPLVPGAERGAPPVIVHSDLQHACIAADAVVDNATLDMTVVGRSVHIGRGARLERCVVLDGATIGAGVRLRGAIVDADTTIPPGVTIGLDAGVDRERFAVTAGGVVVVPRGCFGGTGAAAARGGAGLASHA